MGLKPVHNCKLSVIVCTHNRSHTITGCLDSILASLSAAAPIDAEIVVVDNASTDGTYACVEEWKKSSPFPVSLIRESRKGLSIARNCALRVAKGDLLAFTDDDCRLDNNFVKDALAHDAKDAEPIMRGGRVILGDPADLPITIKDTILKRWERKTRPARHENLSNTVMGCNMVMRRSAVDRIGLFDERLGAGSDIPGGEDTDYIFRAYLLDIPIETVPDMAVIHFHGRRSMRDGKNLFRNYALGSGALYVKYLFRDPDLCRQFYWDCKNAVREILTGKNYFMEGFNFTNKDKVFYSVTGALKYFFSQRPQSSKMKILFITGHNYIPQVYAGAQISISQLCTHLQEKGYTPCVLSGLMTGTLFAWKTRIKMQINKRFLKCKVARDRLPGYSVWRTWHPWEAVQHVAKTEKPDLIVVMAMFPVRMALAAQATKIPIIVKLQDVDFTQHGGNFEELGKIPCAANSDFTAKRYRDAYGVDPVVIYPHIVREKYETKTTRENITYINPHPLKGRHIALELAKRCPDIPFSFVESWPLLKELREDLEKQAALLPNVTLDKSQTDMKKVYGKCRILLVPSLLEEAYGRVVTEAQISGIPVIASNRGGLPEAVGEGGLVLDPDAPIEKWIDAVRKLWDDKAHYNDLSVKASAHARRPEISIQHYMKTWEKLIEDVVAKTEA